MESRLPSTYQGSCLCAAIGYELLGPPRAIGHCHCSQCRKGHGAAYASYGSVPCEALRMLRGADRLVAYASSPTVLRQFCASCGSSLFWSRSAGQYADWISIALGTLDTPFIPTRDTHLHLDAAAPWHLPSTLTNEIDPLKRKPNA